MSKKLTLPLGGKERTFDFGKMWFLKYYGQATGEDPLNATDFLLKPEKQFDFVVNTLYAGLQTDYRSHKLDFDFTKDDVTDWVGNEESDFVDSFLKQFTEISRVKTDVPGEEDAPKEGASVGTN